LAPQASFGLVIRTQTSRSPSVGEVRAIARGEVVAGSLDSFGEEICSHKSSEQTKQKWPGHFQPCGTPDLW
jgi:hypothetical protein